MKRIILTCGLILCLTNNAHAVIFNGSFEQDFDGWELLTETSFSIIPTSAPPKELSYQIHDSSFIASPTYGNKQALIQSIKNETPIHILPLENDVENFLGLTANTYRDYVGIPHDSDCGDLDFKLCGGGLAIKQTVSVNKGDKLKFYWNYLSNTETGLPFYSINDKAFILSGDFTELNDPFNLFSQPENRAKQTGYLTTSHLFKESADVTLGFGLFSSQDDGSGFNNNGLLLDNISLNGQAVVPEPSTLLLFGIGGIGMLFKKRRFSNPIDK